MPTTRYRFLAEFSREDGTPVGSCPFEPDWYPVEESLGFSCIRLYGRKPESAAPTIAPIWDADGPPHIKGVEAEVTVEGEDVVKEEIPLTYFNHQISLVARRLAEGDADKESQLHYRVAAFPDLNFAEDIAMSSDGTIRILSPSILGGAKPLADLTVVSKLVAAEADEANAPFPVFIPIQILWEAEELKKAAGADETGSILIGHLWKDTDSNEVFAEVTAMIPAQHTAATSTKLTFLPETWEAVHAAIQLRGLGESWLGWHHTHPSMYWCKCGPEKQPNCPLGRQFFSTDDVALHRAVFSQAFHIALVTGDRPLPEGGWEQVHCLYGWNRAGMIAHRGFYLFDKSQVSRVEDQVSSVKSPVSNVEYRAAESVSSELSEHVPGNGTPTNAGITHV